MVERAAWVWVAVACFVVALVAGRDAAAQDRLSMSLELPLSPFSQVTYEWKHVGTSPAVAITRMHAGGYGADSEVELVDAADFDAFFAGLEHACAADRAMVAAVPGTARIVWTRNGDSHEREVAVDSACAEFVRASVLAQVHPDRYVMPFWDEGEFGTLRTTSNLAARVWVDGRPTGLVTPVNALRLAPGAREVRWVAVVTGEERVRTVTIEVDMTTSTSVEF